MAESLRIEDDLGDGYVRLLVGEAERRQARHDVRTVEDALLELLRNARDAGATSIYIASSREGGIRRLVVIDDGTGIPARLQDAVFEARVTSKLETVHMDQWGVHGRGMALFSIRENALRAQVAASLEGRGTSVLVDLDTSVVPERADQSTWPMFSHEKDGAEVTELGSDRLSGEDDDREPSPVPEMRGPHNIARCAAEFALSCAPEVRVYLGSSSEVAATLRGRVPADPAVGGIDSDVAAIGPCDRLCLVPGARELMRRAASIGLDVSERTAHRILAGEVAPLADVASMLRSALSAQSDEEISHDGGRGQGSDACRRRKTDLYRDMRGLRVAVDDLTDFSAAMRRAFDDLAQKYYLELDSNPLVRVQSDKITVTFNFNKMD